MWQGYVYVNDVRYSNIFTFAVGIFFVNTTQAEPGRNWRSRFSFFFYLDVLKPCMPVGDVLITGRNCGKFMACPFSEK